MKQTNTHYDFIIIGAGAAGLMLANALGQDAYFQDKRILLLDKDPKKTNDRTWCFWERGSGQFDPIVAKSWNNIFFGGQVFSQQFNIEPYTYKLVRGSDFYQDHLQKINAYAHVDFIEEEVVGIVESKDEVRVSTAKNEYTSPQIFTSVFDFKTLKDQQKYPVLQQHFVGWLVATKEPTFNEDEAVFMDFSVEQRNNTRFMYVLPYSENTALLEYTLFSENLLPIDEYEKAIKDYLNLKYHCTEFEILEKEQGSIPMTSYDFQVHNTKRIQYIGSAGGWTKPSTGYTFYNTSKKIRDLIPLIKNNQPFTSLRSQRKFWFYDLLLLDILFSQNDKGQYIFETLFKNRPPQLIFKFLDEETSLWEDIQIISGCPKKEFIKALLGRLF
ncbi:lycopene cyclase family protein [Maribacter polysiphoniae]|uniref:Lycopene beta-cyclase n=2 Tax=Maribacter polysiphoniae TaxID=429344 RepID=A0A316E978_9FLAO|nr:lycopene cyclase family protein [Maribacter polysiphoniae]PWK25293.1 lycopene beta-cyclase [Maribacter polysiphoniae]